MKRNRSPAVWGGDVAWGGQGRALGRETVSDGARKEGQELCWGRGCRGAQVHEIRLAGGEGKKAAFLVHAASGSSAYR